MKYLVNANGQDIAIDVQPRPIQPDERVQKFSVSLSHADKLALEKLPIGTELTIFGAGCAEEGDSWTIAKTDRRDSEGSINYLLRRIPRWIPAVGMVTVSK